MDGSLFTYHCCAKVDHFYFIKLRKRQKAYSVLDHDIRVWQTVRSLRSQGSDSPLDAKAYFITADYFLYRFDREVLSGNNSFTVTVMPGQFLQLLRPFISQNDDFDRKFVEAFSIPEFRSVSQFSDANRKVLEYLNMYV